MKFNSEIHHLCSKMGSIFAVDDQTIAQVNSPLIARPAARITFYTVVVWKTTNLRRAKLLHN